MQINKAKTTAIIIIFLMMTSVMFMAMQVQPVEAQLAADQPVSGPLQSGVTPDLTIHTVAALSFRPATIGIGQSLLVNFWTTLALPSNNFIHQGYTVTLTKPDGTKDAIKMNSEPATAANWFEYAPDMVGNWTVKFEFAGEYFPAGYYYNGKHVTNNTGTRINGTVYYTPSSTAEQSLIVQQDFVWSWPPSPLPTDYWTRPASPEHREWWPILGNYPGTGYQGGGSTWDALYPNTNPSWNSQQSFTPWVQGPNSAHIVWKQLGSITGIIGGPAGTQSIKTSPGNPSLVYAGRAYQTMTVPINSVPTSCAVCYDLRTGKQYYAIPTAAPTNGTTPNLIAYVNPVPNTATIAGQEIGAVSWSVELLSISGSSLLKVNPLTGAVSNYSIAPLSGGTFYNQIGGYVLNIQDLGAAAGAQRYRLINWTTRGTSTTLASRIASNTTYARSSLPTFIDWNVGLGANAPNNYYNPILNIRYGISVEIVRLSTGESLYNITTGEEDSAYNTGAAIADQGKIAVWTQQGHWIAWDMATGKLAWRSEQGAYPWASTGFGAYNVESAYGMIYYSTYVGIYAFNWTNGKIVWNYRSPSFANFESPYNTNGTEYYPFRCDSVIADGKLYAWNMEHTESYPLTRGWGMYCINATTGESIWHLMIDGDGGVGAIADGYITFASDREGYMYVIGKGKSATTVTASPKTIANGAPVLIEGTVLDISPGQPGTPCVSKDSMSLQMEYLHKQMPIAGIWGNETITGVPVTLTAIASDGTVTDIGTTTTNGYYGTFAYAWAPQSTGTYQIAATFMGDDSYGTSSAATAVTVSSAPATPTPVPTPPQAAAAPDYTAMIIGSTVAIIIAVAIATVLIIRKRP